MARRSMESAVSTSMRAKAASVAAVPSASCGRRIAPKPSTDGRKPIPPKSRYCIVLLPHPAVRSARCGPPTSSVTLQPFREEHAALCHVLEGVLLDDDDEGVLGDVRDCAGRVGELPGELLLHVERERGSLDGDDRHGVPPLECAGALRDAG